MQTCKHCQQLVKALKVVVTLCDDGDADALTQAAARVAKSVLKHIKHKETSKDV